MIVTVKMKRFLLPFILMIAVAAAGCSFFKKSKGTARPAATAPKPIVTPDFSLSAKVISVNTVGRFVILNFPPGRLPQMEQTLFLYRAGLKVAEVKITGPQQDSDIVADLVTGDAKVGDIVRDQ